MLTRRSFIATSAATAVATLSGCCCKSARSINLDLSKAITYSTQGYYPLAPGPTNTKYRSASRVVDVHTHIFNASDLQVAGYLRGPVAYEFAKEDDFLFKIIQKLASIVEDVAHSIAISATREYERLIRIKPDLSTGAKNFANQKVIQRNILTSEDEERLSQAAKMIFDRIKETSLKSEIDTYLQKDSKLRTFNNSDIAQEFTEDALLDVFSNNSHIKSLRKINSSSGLSFWGIWTFIKHLLNSRSGNLTSYQKHFTTNEGVLGIDKCYSALVDFDHWLGDCDHSLSLLKDQMLVNELISKMSDGFMTPIIAYNPLTDLKENEASLYLVEDALERGFAGVKIYPTMGFFPYNNAGLKGAGKYPADGLKVDLKRIDEQLSKLYEICDKYQVPIMSHSNFSLGRVPSHKILGGPLGWEQFFTDPGNNKKIKVNLGHFGGESNEKEWWNRFITLMNKPSANNLYGDLSYWVESLKNKNTNKIRDLAAMLNTPLSNGEKVQDRLMFGSDWLMIAREDNWERYAAAFEDALETVGVAFEVREKIFHKNADRLFNKTILNTI